MNSSLRGAGSIFRIILRRCFSFGAAAALFYLSVDIASGQGSLNPPGPPAPTMKTLAQIEPRTPIGSLPFTIATPGSFYLTTNLTGAAGLDGILIQTSDVTIDLGGFDLNGSTGALAAIRLGAGVENVAIRHGSIRGWTTGISASSANRCTIQDLRVAGSAGTGIAVGTDSVVRDCLTWGNQGHGVICDSGSRVSNCTASSNGGNGLVVSNACQIVGSLASNNGAIGFLAGSDAQLDKCKSSGNGAAGVSVGADATINETTASANLDIGILTGAGAQIVNCKASENAKGISVQGDSTVRGCQTFQNSGDGILVTSECTVSGNNCKGNFLARDAAGIHAIGSGNVIQENVVISNDWGIRVEMAGNMIVRNVANNNSLQYSLGVTTQAIGPILSGDGLVGDTNPAANFQF